MGYRLGCPACDAWTSAVFRAYENGEGCPYCGGLLNTVANARHFSEQLPQWCTSCPHPHHAGRCGYYIAETIHDDVGIFAPPSYMEREFLIGTCQCKGDAT